ncbi:MAG: hypothetical protein H0V49_13460 [Nocardioidaceae bacterium]|nr:hypothetical protein [Nocardioidaceae bacterium]
MGAFAEQCTHLRLRHLGACDAEGRCATTQPDAGRVAVRGVIVGEGLTRRAALVGGRDLAGEVGVPVTRRELVNRHHANHNPEGRGPGRAGIAGVSCDLRAMSTGETGPLTAATGQ